MDRQEERLDEVLAQPSSPQSSYVVVLATLKSPQQDMQREQAVSEFQPRKQNAEDLS